jgi:4-diphosphocytidyl-2C-methyl-D-erythritol kinase
MYNHRDIPFHSSKMVFLSVQIEDVYSIYFHQSERKWKVVREKRGMKQNSQIAYKKVLATFYTKSFLYFLSTETHEQRKHILFTL